MKYVTHTEAGEGLIFYGNVVLDVYKRQEYWREKEAEHRRFATEYVTRRGLIPQQ